MQVVILLCTNVLLVNLDFKCTLEIHIFANKYKNAEYGFSELHTQHLHNV